MRTVTVLILAALALQALGAERAAAFRLGEGGDANADQVGLDGLDLSDKSDLELLGLNELGPAGGLGGLGSPKAIFDVTGVMRALQSILNAINEQIRNSTNALATAVASAGRQAEVVVQNTINSWNRSLQGVANYTAQLNATLAECQARQPSLQSVGDALLADVQECVHNTSAASQAALAELKSLAPQVEALIDQAVQNIADCESAGLFQALCVAGRLRELGMQGAALAGNATRLGVRIAAELGVRLPMKNARCVAAAAQARTAQAFDIIDAIRQCVRDSVSTTTSPAPATTSPAPTTASPDPATASPDPATAAPEPATASPDPATAAPEPATASPDPATAAPEPATASPDPATAAPTQ